jgi:methyl-accepting chemotaxis protein
VRRRASPTTSTEADTDYDTLSPPPSRRGLDRLPLHVQLVLGIGSLVLLVTISSVVAIALIVRVADDGESLADRSAYSESIGAAALDAKGAANDERGYLITGEDHFARSAGTRIGHAATAFKAAYAAAATPTQRQAVTVSRSQFQRWAAAVKTEFATYRAGRHRQAISLAIGPNRQLRKEYERSLAGANSLAARGVVTAQHSISSALTRSVAILVACLVVALALAVAIGLWLAHTIVRPLQSLIALLGNAEHLRVVG